MVRVCWLDSSESNAAAQGSPPSAPWVEIDLTGVPELLLPALFPAALAAIRWVAAWAAGPVEFLAADARNCRALEVCSPRD